MHDSSPQFRDSAVAVPTVAALSSSSMKVLDVGCGQNKYPGSIGLDYNERTGADVIHDLRQFPYPFADNEFDLVYASHVVEHIPDVIGFVTELHRIAKPGGRIRFITPHYTNPEWANDPTHIHLFNSYSFNVFQPELRHFEFYTETNLRLVSRHVGLVNLYKALGFEALLNLDERWPSMRFLRKFWEQYLCYIVRGKVMEFEFEVLKGPSQPTV